MAQQQQQNKNRSGDWKTKDGSAGRSVGDFTNEDGYWKLLIDRRMYDREGNYQDITPIDSEGFRGDMIDPAKTADRFHVTEDGDIMVYGEGDNYEAMVNRRGEREDARRERWRRQEQRAGGRQVLELMRRLGVSVTFVDMMSPRERAQLSRRQQRAKGWYDPRTGRVYINLSRHSRGDDVVAKFLHEVVARKGLRELFGKDFDAFLNNVFNNVSEDIRKEIVEMANRRDWDFLTATEEYLALLAQSTDFDDARNRKVWSKVINFFMDLLRKAGITLNRPLSDNELRYILWRSYNRMEQRGVMGLADDIVMRDKLDIDSVLSVADDEASTEMQRAAARAVLNREERREKGGEFNAETMQLEERVKGQGTGRRYSFSRSKEEFDQTRERAVREKGIVAPGLANKNVEIVEVKKTKDGKLHPFDLTLNETKRKRQVQAYAEENGLIGEVPVENGAVYVSRTSIGNFVDDKHIKKSTTNGVDPNVHIATVLRINDVISNSVDCEIYPDRNVKSQGGTRDVKDGVSLTTLMHVLYGCVKVDGKEYSVRTLVKETKGRGKNSAYVYSLEEIDVSDGHNEAVKSEPTRKSDTSISVANLIKDVGKTMEPDKLLLDYSAKTAENGSGALNGGEGVRGDASQNETTSADGRRLSLVGDREERKALRESEESRKLFEATKKKFGTTKDINEAGYILPDGTMLDFSGRHWMDEGQDTSHLAGSRAVDHREISDVGYDKDENETGFKTDMSDFINRGAIRVHRSGNYSRINLSMEPTAEQMKVLRRFAAGVDNVDVDFGDGNHSDHFAEYEDAWPSRVLGDIDRYFTEGIIPSGSRRYSLTKAPTFYSNAERAVENVKQEKAKAEQWKAMLTKAGGIKAGEDKWMGLSQWLDEHKGKLLTKDEVMQFIKDNSIEMEEVNYGEAIFSNNSIKNLEGDIKRGIANGESIEDVLSAWDKEFGDTKLQEYRDGRFEISEDGSLTSDEQMRFPVNSTRLAYTTPGLDNNREIAFVVPDVEPYQKHDSIHFGPENEGRAVMWVRFGETTDADGKRVLVIDEIQSNRHQDAREKGYKGVEQRRRIKELNKEIEQAQADFSKFSDFLFKKYGAVSNWTKTDRVREEWGWKHRLVPNEDVLTEEEVSKWNDGKSKLDALRDEKEKLIQQDMLASGVPAAPFEKNWHEVAMKRMLRLAAEEGFDKVAWTTGEQQAERYDIGNAVERIEKLDDSTFLVYPEDGSAYQELEFDEDGVYRDDTDALLNNKTMADIFGKETAEKLKNLSDGDQLTGEGLRIGGEGMKGFYDQMLPRFMDKYGKKWGVKTGTVELPNVEEAGRTMHAVDVTPEMKESVMQGQPLFSLNGGERVRVRIDNGRFNEELDNLERGELPNGHIFNIGRPASILRSAGFPDAPIELSATKLAEKARQHGFAIGDVRNLAAALQDPVAVFAYGDKGKAQNVIVEIVRDGKNFVVGVHFNQTRRGVEVSDIRGLFPKDNAEWLNWINQGKLLYVDKEKIQTLIDQQRTNPAEVAYLDLDSVANLVNNFENPSIQSVKTTENGRKYSLSGGAQTHTENFKRWFGDWENDPENASKVVDENGRPKVVLHGTPNKDFFAFDSDKVGSGTDAGWLGRGFYFYGNAPEYASQYAGKSGRVLQVYLDIKNPYYASVEEFDRLAEANDPELSKQFREQLEEEGYDGVYYNGDLNEEWVAFRPEQIKSATDNNGEFSRENPDIRFSLNKLRSGKDVAADVSADVELDSDATELQRLAADAVRRESESQTGEKTTSSERSGAISGNSSSGSLLSKGSGHLSHNALAPQKDAAKIQKNTEITLRAAKKIQNQGGLKGETETEEQAVRAIGKELHLEKSASSQSYYGDFYEGDFVMNDGSVVHVRVSDHPATNFRMGNANADHKVSVVIRKNGEHKDFGPHNGYTEITYEPSEISPAEAANAVVAGIESLIKTGEYKDVTGKAHSQDYPYVDENGVRHYSLNGGARRWWGEREAALRSEYDALAQQARPLRRAPSGHGLLAE